MKIVPEYSTIEARPILRFKDGDFVIDYLTTVQELFSSMTKALRTGKFPKKATILEDSNGMFAELYFTVQDGDIIVDIEDFKTFVINGSMIQKYDSEISKAEMQWQRDFDRETVNMYLQDDNYAY